MNARRIVRLTAVALLLAVPAAVALAQGRGHRGISGGDGLGFGPHMLGRLADRLELTDAQRETIRGIVEAARDDTEPLRAELRENREAFRQAHPPTSFDEAALRAHIAEQQEIRTELAVHAAKTRAEVLKVLTPEQLAELEGMRDCFEERAGSFGQGRWRR